MYGWYVQEVTTEKGKSWLSEVSSLDHHYPLLHSVWLRVTHSTNSVQFIQCRVQNRQFRTPLGLKSLHIHASVMVPLMPQWINNLRSSIMTTSYSYTIYVPDLYTQVQSVGNEHEIKWRATSQYCPTKQIQPPSQQCPLLNEHWGRQKILTFPVLWRRCDRRWGCLGSWCGACRMVDQFTR